MRGRRRSSQLAVLAALALIACGEDEFTKLPDGPIPTDGMMPDGMMPDGMVPDGMVPDGMVPDSGITPDSGVDASADAAADAAADSSTDSPVDTATADTPGADAATDAPRGSDAGTDAPSDAGADAPRGSDAGADAPRGSDAGADAPRGSDAGADAGTDAPRDAGSDGPRGSDAGSDGGNPDAGTDGGVAIPACPVNTWCTETSPVAGKLLSGVYAASANDVFVVGSSGTILHRHNGTAWTQMTSNTTADLRGVWGLSATDVWAVGENGTIRRFDGTTWQVVSASTTLDFDAVWGSGPNDVWISGFGAVVHWNGSTFETKALTGELFAIHGTGPLDVWTTGENAFVDRFTGTWTTGIKPDGAQSTFFAIHALSSTNVFVSSFIPNKETLQFNGTSWIARPCKIATSSCIFQAFFSTSATNVWGVGGSKIGRWNGTLWAAEAPLGSTVQLWDVSGSGADVWVVGSDSLILHRN